MPRSRSVSRPAQRHPVAKQIVRAWRELTGHTTRGPLGSDAGTLLACSGGADSSALVLALASLGEPMVVGHIVHDLRPRAEALADRDAAARLADRLGLRFVEAEVSVRARGGNAEDAARRLRYEALAKLARESGCPFVATAHHADDQLETLLMRLLRGSGPSGLAGVAARRRLAAGVTLIRPMLTAARAEAESICDTEGWVWQTDTTNADVSRLRAAIRHRVVPVLKEIRPDAPRRAAGTARLMRAAAEVIDDRVAAVMKHALDHAETRAGSTKNGISAVIRWPREALKDEPAIVIGGALRAAARRIGRGRGLDRVGQASIDRVVRAIGDGVGGRRELRLGPALVRVSAATVTVERASKGRGGKEAGGESRDE